MTKIDSSYYLSNQPRKATGTELGQEEFLKLLMAQIKNQDPLNPMDDTQFVSQLATFSQLEQMINVNGTISKMAQNQIMSPVVQYSHLIGKEVSYYKFDDVTGKVVEPKKIISSQVYAISEQEGFAVIELADGQKIYTDEIIKINDPSVK